MKGFHFYTASQVESDNIRATLPQYTFENVGYYVMGPQAPSYTLGGALSGLTAGRSLVLQNNGVDELTLSANGSFLFAAPLSLDSPFNVSVKTQPVGQTCSVSVGAGTVSANVASVLVSCVTNQYTMGGTVSGLEAGRSLILNVASRNRTINANGAFALTGFTVPHGTSYSASFLAQPAGQTCSIANATGTALADVTDLQITCTSNTYTVGGSLSGLGAGKSVTISLNMGEQLVLTGNAPFVFETTLAYNATYMVNVRAHPSGQVCTFIGSSGTIRNNVTTVALTCIDTNHSVGGTVNGLLAGRSLVLQNNAGNDLTVSASGAFAFSTRLNTGTAYNVTVRTQPLGQSCSVVNGSGTVTAQVSNVQVSCGVSVYSVGGSIIGLGAGKTLVLQNNAGDDLTRTINGNFAFSVAIPYGSPYAVSVRAQPVDQTCTVANGLGTVNGLVSNVAVSCADHVTVGGTLSGLIAGNPVVLTLNGGGDLTLPANGGFTFASKAPLGATYVVGVKTQPRGQTCTVSNATGMVNAAVGNVAVACVNSSPTNLLITEVGSCGYSNTVCWLEVFNPTAISRSLSDYRLRTVDYTDAARVFSLPNVVIESGSYRLIASGLGQQVLPAELNPVVVVGSGADFPRWGQRSGTINGVPIPPSGLVELIAGVSDISVDGIRFGANLQSTILVGPDQWLGQPQDSGFSNNHWQVVVRKFQSSGYQDTDRSLDWDTVDYSTPGGRNDVTPGATDLDNDGLPDANEMPGTTYNGLDLYSMGARTGQLDIFVEVDHMNSAKAGVIPRLASMQMVKNAFALRGVAVHIDAGNLFAAGFDPSQFNLGQGSSTVPYEACLGFGSTDCASNTSASYRTVYDWKWQHFDPRRRAVFHYALFGDAAASPSWGRGELFGNDFVVTQGDITTGSDWLTNQQASTFMHELGHNLGLQHGGDEERNYKPNYPSVMNYLKDSISPGNSIWPFMDWKWAFGTSSGSVTCYPGNTHPLCTAEPAPFVIDYSDGSSLPLNESALYESANVGRGALPGVYADWDENGSLTTTAVARDLNGDGVMGVLTDHNDWAALTLPFVRQYAGGLMQKSFKVGIARKAAKVPEHGATVPNPLFGDRGPTVVVCGGDPRGTNILRALRAKSAAERARALRSR